MGILFLVLSLPPTENKYITNSHFQIVYMLIFHAFIVFEIFVNVKNDVNLIEINSNLNISTVVRMTAPHTLSSFCKKYKMFVTFLCRPKTF